MEHRRVVVSRHGGPEVLRVVHADACEPAAGEARVKVLAAGVSGFDLMYRRSSRLPGAPTVPFTLGEDVVGVVDAVGEGVSGLESGQVVAGATWALGVGGGYADYVCLPARDLVPVPAGIDPAEAVCLVANYLTAHLHLYRYADAQDSERVLVHGAAGGVGSALLDLGKLGGLEMYGTASEGNGELVSEFGATPIDYRNEDFVERVGNLTGDGVDIVVDPVGGARQLWRSYRTLRPGGRLVWLGSAATKGRTPWAGLLSLPMVYFLKLLPDGKSVPSCPDVGRYAEAHPDWYRETLSGLLDSLTAHQLTPIVARRMPLAEAAQAHRLLERGGVGGKIVLVTET
jgi:NADPH:quinone reductase-like Zn-dependent oxidoreductase